MCRALGINFLFLLSICAATALNMPDIALPLEVQDANIYHLKNLGDVLKVLSPNFPANYPDNQNISYWFKAEQRALIIKAETINLQAIEPSGVCLKDYIVFWDLQYPYSIMKIACGNAKFEFTTYSGSVMMQFISDGSQNFKGFNITLRQTTLCAEADLQCPSSYADQVRCITSDRICDGNNDCLTGEDEICTQQCGISQPQNQENRIVGGIDAVPNAWPWQTDVVINNSSGCGGSLIAPGWVVTAGHCCVQYGDLFPVQNYRLRFAYQKCKDKSDGKTVTVDKMFVHPKYAETTYGAIYDYCLLKLKEVVQITPQITPICLPRPNSNPKAGETCVATGCGNTVQWVGSQTGNVIIPEKLQMVNLTTVANTQCVKSFPLLTPEMNCAFQQDKDTCQGDSGGPLVCKGPDLTNLKQYQLTGITSYGFGCASGLPGVFADTRRLLPFLVITIYKNHKWGWFQDTSVPIIPRGKGEPLIQPNVLRVLPPEKTDADEPPENRAASFLSVHIPLLIGLCFWSLICFLNSYHWNFVLFLCAK